MSDLSAVHSTSARPAFVEGAHRHQLAADVGVDDDRIGLLVRRLRPGQRAALDAVLGVLRGVLVGDLADRQALQADAEARLVHHHEHGLQAAILLADQIARWPRHNS
jgi:hypothetical protein